MCTHPLHAFQIGWTDALKPKYKIVGGNVERIHMPRLTGSKNNIHVNSFWQDRWLTDYIEVPCGKCIQCRLSYSREWATRCVLEAKSYQFNYFITLTYDNEHLPINKTIIDKSTGEIVPNPTLVKKDLQDFMKRLRIHYKREYNHENIRFYACGEYGEQFQRPHYHLILFNLPMFDLVPFGKNELGQTYFYSQILSNIWGKGFVGVANVTWETCAYVARYVMKKQKGPGSAEYYDQLGQVPEFVLMSRRPGIGRDYYENNKEQIYATDEIILPGKDGKAQVLKPSHYYDKLYDIDCDDPFVMREIKEARRECAKQSMNIKLSKTSLTKDEYLDLVDRKKHEQVKKLVRRLK